MVEVRDGCKVSTHWWEYASKEDLERARSQLWPTDGTPVDPFLSHNDVYVTAESGLMEELSKPGARVLLPAGETIKILSRTCQEPWVYVVRHAVVRMHGTFLASLKAGTRIAVLPTNYRELLRKNTDGSTAPGSTT